MGALPKGENLMGMGQGLWQSLDLFFRGSITGLKPAAQGPVERERHAADELCFQGRA